MEQYRELIRKAERAKKQGQTACVTGGLFVILLIMLVTYMMIMYEEPTNLNIFFLCASWAIGGIALVTIHYFYKDL